MRNIKVFGHKSPDTDAICSAIVYAWYLREIKQRSATAYRLGELNKETEFVLKSFGFKKPLLLKELTGKDRVVVVDTNNKDELIDLNGAKLLEVLDHHKLTAGFNTVDPMNFTLRKTASTATVIYLRFNSRGVYNYPKGIAGLMLSAIISDSIKFTSPTTTDIDVRIAKKIAKKYDINIDELADKMFDAKSNISKLSDKDLVLYDSKITKINNKTFRISVVETNKPENVFSKSENIQKEIEKIKKDERLDEVLVFAVDILNKESTLLNKDNHSKDLIRDAFTIEREYQHGILLPGIISRKKQIIPALAN